MKTLPWLICLLAALAGCSSGSGRPPAPFSTAVVHGETPIITPAEHPGMALPGFVRTADDYFLVYGGKLRKIFKYNYDGTLLDSFGGKGRGPGEFLSLTNYWIRDDHYLLYDYNGAKMVRYSLDGSFLGEQPVHTAKLTMGIALLSADRFVHPARPAGSALLQVTDITRNKVVASMGDPIAGTGASQNENDRSLIRRGKVPPSMLREVTVGANSSGIFAFGDATARLQKYSRGGQLLWERNMKLPVTRGVRADFFAQNGKFIYPLTYGYGICVRPGGAALLLHTTGDTTMVAWVPNDGRHIRVLKFPAVHPAATIPIRFSVIPARHLILFVNSMKGTIVTAEWPVSAPEEE